MLQIVDATPSILSLLAIVLVVASDKAKSMSSASDHRCAHSPAISPAQSTSMLSMHAYDLCFPVLDNPLCCIVSRSEPLIAPVTFT